MGEAQGVRDFTDRGVGSRCLDRNCQRVASSAYRNGFERSDRCTHFLGRAVAGSFPAAWRRVATRWGEKVIKMFSFESHTHRSYTNRSAAS